MERGQAGRFQIKRDVFPVKGEILLAVDGDAVVDVVDVVALAAVEDLLNKKQNDLAKIFGKFRRCTIDRKDQIFAELAALVKQ